MSKLITIQVLRALAALAIVVHHASYDAQAVGAGAGLAFVRHDVLPWAAGVDLFFVISGFIMVHASASLFGTNGAGTFLVRRIVRIVPLYWLFTTAYLGVVMLMPQTLNGGTPSPWQIAASYAFLPVAGPDGDMQPIYSLGWTLNYEMFFYLVFAAAIVLPRTWAVGTVAFALGTFVLIGRLVPLPQPLAFWSDSIVLEFVLGMGLGLLRAGGVRISPLFSLGLSILGLALLHWNLGRWLGAPFDVRALSWGLPAACLVAAAGLGQGTAWRVSALERGCVALGDASYALYLVHPFAVRALRELFMRTGLADTLGTAGYMAAALAASLLAALAVHRMFERPVIDALRKATASGRLAARASK